LSRPNARRMAFLAATFAVGFVILAVCSISYRRSTRPMIIVSSPRPALSEYLVPTPLGYPYDIAIDKRGKVWFSELDGIKIGCFDPSTRTFKEFPLPPSVFGPLGIEFDSEGMLWIATPPNKILRFDPYTTRYATYEIPGEGTFDIAVDEKGNVWYTVFSGNKVGKLEPNTGLVEDYLIPTFNSQPACLDIDEGGLIWFTEFNASKIGCFDPNKKSFDEYELTLGSAPFGITVDRHGVVWFTEHKANKVGKIVPSQLAISEYQLPHLNSGPRGIAADDHGLVWFTEFDGERVVRIDPESETFLEVSLPLDSGPSRIVVDSEGVVWFTESRGNRIGRLTHPQTGVLHLVHKPATQCTFSPS